MKKLNNSLPLMNLRTRLHSRRKTATSFVNFSCETIHSLILIFQDGCISACVFFQFLYTSTPFLIEYKTWLVSTVLTLGLHSHTYLTHIKSGIWCYFRLHRFRSLSLWFLRLYVRSRSLLWHLNA